MKMFIIKSMDWIMYVVAALVIIAGGFTGQVAVLLGCIVGSVVLVASWCVLSSIACDIRAIRMRGEDDK